MASNAASLNAVRETMDGARSGRVGVCTFLSLLGAGGVGDAALSVAPVRLGFVRLLGFVLFVARQ